jgi:hypothetical protein
MSGLPDGALTDRGMTTHTVLRKAFSPAELARRVREALDAVARHSRGAGATAAEDL